MRRFLSPLVLALAMVTASGLAASPAMAAPGAAAPGARLWISRYSGPARNDRAFSVAVSPNGARVYVTGSSYRGRADGYAYRTVAYSAATGRRIWVAGYQGRRRNNSGDPFSVVVSPNGRTVYVTGASAGAHSSFDYATVAYRASNGRRLWVRRYNGPGNGDDEARSVVVSPNGRTVYVTGESWGKASAYDYATIAYRASTGRRLWVRRYNDPAHGPDHAFSLAVSPNGRRVYVTGNSSTANYTYDYATIAYNASTGRRLWIRRYNGPGNGVDEAHSVAVSPNSRVVYVTGASAGANRQYAYATIAYNAATGRRLWLRRASGQGGGGAQAYSVAASPDGRTVYVTGQAAVGSASAGHLAYLTVAYRAGNGARLWARSYPGTAAPGEGTSLALGPRGKKVYVTGWTVTARGWAYGTVGYAATTGAQLWARSYPATNDTSYAPALAVSRSTGRVYVAGTTLVGTRQASEYVTIAYRG